MNESIKNLKPNKRMKESYNNILKNHGAKNAEELEQIRKSTPLENELNIVGFNIQQSFK